MIALKADYLNFLYAFQAYLYLEHVDEAFIRTNYKEVLLSESLPSLEGCNTDVVEAFFHMKHQAISELFSLKEEEKLQETPSNPTAHLTS